MYISIKKDWFEENKEKLINEAEEHFGDRKYIVIQTDGKPEYDADTNHSIYIHDEKTHNDEAVAFVSLPFDLRDLDIDYKFSVMKRLLDTFNKVKKMIKSVK